ncbi:hypothetical protein LTR01_007412 [Friedmanniomyces endolithicus]|nr:hypothetical protein LTR01_007412 [Friedmanniomyces endolithicus]KAK0833674.1 hypothetical protein LTR73_001437 [Friedmanniomyces endolithicus]
MYLTHATLTSTVHIESLSFSHKSRPQQSPPSRGCRRENETPHPQLPHLRAQNVQVLPGGFSLAPQGRRARAGGDGDESGVFEEYSAEAGVGGYEEYYYRKTPDPGALLENDGNGDGEDAGSAGPSQIARDLHALLMETCIASGKLVCGNCGHEYAVKEGIANFLLPSHMV